ncbi:MAG TPA: response regulator [Terracidiphilus sp.]|jgi:CheY-like chemotaxis protein
MTTKDKHYRPSILVVDDEPVVADTLVEILKQMGYAANASYDGKDAIQAALLRPPQLVISDVMMPEMNGIELGISIRRIFPDCKVILSSGHSGSSDLISAALSAGNHFVFLQKPVHPTVLLKHVAECLPITGKAAV